MKRYYFDIRDSRGLSADEEGLVFESQLEAEIEAAVTLADMAKEFADIRSDVAVEVRTDGGMVFQAAFTFSRTRANQ